MKKLIAIFFLLTYFFSTTEAHQLFKLPVVFQHFGEHKKTNPTLSLFAFLEMHYLHGSPRDKDYDRDMQLPFKTNHDCLSSVLQGFVPNIVLFNIGLPVKVIAIELLPAKNQHIHSFYLSSIWQPPRLC